MTTDIAADSAELQRDKLDLRDVLSEAYATAKRTCAHGHQLVLTLPPDPVWISGDFTRLRETSEHLLESACKHTAPHGRLRLSLKQAKGSAVIRVGHEGIGLIRAEEKRRLAAAKRCVELHGGTLEAGSSSARKGQPRKAQFTLCLPLATSEDPP